jgi:replicative DNA helicase
VTAVSVSTAAAIQSTVDVGTASADLKTASAHIDPASLHSIELEQGLLGAILNANSVLDIIEPLVSVEDFFEPLHHHIFHSFAHLRASGGMITVPLVRAALGGDGSVTIGASSMTVRQYVARLAAEAITVREAPFES